MDRGANTPAAEQLAKDYFEMLELPDYAERAWNARRLAALSQREMQFGVRELRWTRMGNIAAALDDDAQTRYGMHLATFWNRMQPVLQGNESSAACCPAQRFSWTFLWCPAGSVC